MSDESTGDDFPGNDFSGLRSRLTELADAPAPASPFDAAQVAAVGRRRVLASRASAAGGGGVLAVAAVVGAMTLFAPGAAPHTMTGSGIGTDPVVAFAGFGWLPASLPNVSYASSMNAADNKVFAQGNTGPEDATPRVELRLLTPGDGPGTADSLEHLIPATLNDGRRAYWVTQAGNQPSTDIDGVFQLRFPAKDGRWAALTWGVDGNQNDALKISGTPAGTTGSTGTTGTTVNGTPPSAVPASAEWQQTLLRMATQVTTAPAQIPLPVRLTGLPPDLRPNLAYMSRSGTDQSAPGKSWSLAILFSTVDPSRTMVDVGLAGTVGRSGNGNECATSAGLEVCVKDSGDPRKLAAVGGAKGLLKHITLLGTDESRWTTNVIVP